MRDLALLVTVLVTGSRCGTGAEHDCQPTEVYFRDADGDGYGAATGPTVMACKDQRVPGHAPRPGDCNDNDARAFPGTRAWQRTPLLDGDGPRAWDFNCDGFVTLRWRPTGVCRQGPGYCEIVTAPAVEDGYWSEDSGPVPPPCGREALWVHWCRAPGPTCVVDATRRIQECL